MNHVARLGGTASAAVGMVMLLGTAALAAPTVTKSDNSAGYSVIAGSPITSFSGTLNVPKVTCPATGSSGMSAVISLSDPSSAGSASFGWSANCSGGSAQYDDSFAGLILDGRFAGTDTTIAPGDSLKFSMTQSTTKGTVKVTVIDETNKLSGTATAHIDPSLTDLAAETSFFVGGSSGVVTPIPSFTPVVFGSLKFNGVALSSLNPTKIEMYDGIVLQVATSSIGSSGTFSTTFRHA